MHCNVNYIFFKKGKVYGWLGVYRVEFKERASPLQVSSQCVPIDLINKFISVNTCKRHLCFISNLINPTLTSNFILKPSWACGIVLRCTSLIEPQNKP